MWIWCRPSGKMPIWAITACIAAAPARGRRRTSRPTSRTSGQRGRLQETRLIKPCRNQKNLDFPSFYLELAVIEALSNTNYATVSDRVAACFSYLRDSFPNARFVDPANTNNVISDDLTAAEKQRISTAAGQAFNSTWDQVIR